MEHNHTYRTHIGRAALLAILMIEGATLMGAVESSAARHQTIAHAARSLNITDTAHLELIKPEGSELYEEGPVTGSLPGSMRAQLNTGSVFTGSFTIHTHGGSITGHGGATPHGSGRYQSFGGSFNVTGGTGRYIHVKGRAGLYGLFDRRTDSVVIQTAGKLSY
jgi:hypothetical protein